MALWRRLVKRGIRAVASGGPATAAPTAARPVPTYTQDTIVRLPARDPDDPGSLREFGRKVAAIVLDSAGLGHAERAARLEALRTP